jgi:hypothetical protein
VTGKRLAETMARFGPGVLPQDMALDPMDRIVPHIRGADPRYETPLLVVPTATVRDVEGIIRKRVYNMVIVVDANESVGALYVDMVTNLQSAVTYVGAGYSEGTPHGRVRK